MTRPFVFVLLLLLLLGGALAQEEASTSTLDLNEAMELSLTASTEVLDARRELAGAQADLDRLRADPLALDLDIFLAEQDVSAARDGVETATASARVAAARAFVDALEAQAAVEEATMRLAIASVRLEAAQAKREAGAATDLDVAEATNQVAAADRDLRDAQASYELASSTLQKLVGTDAAELTAITHEDLQEIPSLDRALDEALEVNTRLAAAERAVESARRKLAAVDHAASAQVDIDAARETLVDAEADLGVLLEDLELTLRQMHADVVAMQNRLASAQESYAASDANLEGQRARLQAGSISPLALREAESSHLAASNDLAEARHALLLALLELENAILD